MSKIQAEYKGSGMELLWTNQSPSAAFASQTIPISNINDYDLLYVYMDGVAVLKESMRSGVVTAMYSGPTGGAVYTFARGVDLNSSGVFIRDCTKTKVVDGTFSTDNTFLIPLRIYGIKL